jgi:hypothetical protein
MESDDALADRLYLNDGTGRFTQSTTWLPAFRTSKSCIAAADYDHDGRIDVFVGGRVIPGKYPKTPVSFLLHNSGDRFTNAGAAMLPDGGQLGMVTDAIWADVNGDSWEDLIVVGEFMNIEVFANKAGASFERITDKVFDKPLPGMWNKIVSGDFDNDGDLDFIVGNLGLNTRLRASGAEPIELVYDDFDRDNIIDPIFTCFIQGVSYPFASRDELVEQINKMKTKFPTYKSYADARLEDVFTADELSRAHTLKATHLESIYLENRNGKLVVHPLPLEAQFSPLYALHVADLNGDGNLDFVAAGNQSAIRVRLGPVDANFGQVFTGDGKGNFSYMKQADAGLAVVGDVKSIGMIDVKNTSYLLVGVNNVGISCYKLVTK